MVVFLRSRARPNTLESKCRTGGEVCAVEVVSKGCPCSVCFVLSVLVRAKSRSCVSWSHKSEE